VLSAMVQLDEDEREVLALAVGEDLSYRAIADLAGISEANVKVRLLRARLALREALTETFGDKSRRLVPDHAEPDHSTAAEELLQLYENPARGRIR